MKNRFISHLIYLCLSLAVAICVSGSSTAVKSATAKPMWKMRSLTATAQPVGYSPTQIKRAYGFDSNFGTGKGKTIAIVTAYGSQNIKSDLAVFDAQYNLPSADITVYSDGVTDGDSGWAIETTLDVEWAHAMAPDAKLIVVAAASDDSVHLLSAVDFAADSGAEIVSMSWGCNEIVSEVYADWHFSKSGVVFLSASGDEGEGAMWPSSSSNVISVGGTTLSLDSSGNRKTETAWSGSGGGTSQYEKVPDWQSKFGISSSTRQSPDVSFDANPSTGVPIYCSVQYKGSAGWFKVGGTSFGTPAWAGIIADLNQDTAYIKNAASLYELAGDTGYTNAAGCFFDITSGSNATGSSGGYSALTGYDQVTGLGSPQCSNLAPRGVSYSAHVQNIGWQPYVYDGSEAGTSGKALRLEGLKIKLTGDMPVGASVTYQAHVQSKGWQSVVSDGALTGTLGLSKRLEALKITLSGFPGYQVSYRVHIQHYGWLDWQTSKNGTGIDDAGIAGTVGKALRVEAVEIKIEKSAS